MSITKSFDVAAIAVDLKHELLEVISPVLIRYREEYGLTPSAIHFDMVESTMFGCDRTKTFVLSDVRVDFEF